MDFRDWRRWGALWAWMIAALSVCARAEILAAETPAAAPQRRDPPPGEARGPASPLYLLTYDHGGLVLWGSDHFAKHLQSAAQWLDRYPSFKIGLVIEESNVPPVHTLNRPDQEGPFGVAPPWPEP